MGCWYQHPGHPLKKEEKTHHQVLLVLLCPAASSGMHNLVSAEDVNPVDESEIYSDSSEGEELPDGAYGGYAARVTEGQIPVNLEEYMSDKSNDPICNYRTQRNPPTPPCPRPTEDEGAFRVIVDYNDDIDTSTYFSDEESDDE